MDQAGHDVLLRGLYSAGVMLQSRREPPFITSSEIDSPEGV